jgi:2-dehydro-3-deoxy-D-arabinonate dehydratase
VGADVISIQYLTNMKIYKTTNGIVIEKNGDYYFKEGIDWDNFMNTDPLIDHIESAIASFNKIQSEEFDQLKIMAPVSKQEVWAAGVTYLRSRDARIEESKDAGGGTFYDKVYLAERPELFFKATPYRVVHPGEHVRIRKDSSWNVPEPELTLFINNRGKIAGYSIGNDMSSRSIEGENPLYLPQAKVYDGSAAIGPCVYVSKDGLPPQTLITILIERNGQNVFDGQVRVDRIKRDLNELAEYLYRECSFPHGCFLMTGTGVVPPNEFTLQEADQISISIDNIGTLKNTVAL